jgi:hypothetical protein
MLILYRREWAGLDHEDDMGKDLSTMYYRVLEASL